MVLILDTHSFLWAAEEPHKLSTAARKELESADNELLVSALSVWEIILKAQKGRGLQVPDLADLDSYIPRQIDRLGARRLDLTHEHALALTRLPARTDHRDPFDRLLVAQALVENATLVTRDAKLVGYPISYLW